MTQCLDPELLMLMRFLVPILHPRKQTYVPAGLANTIIVSMKQNRKINLASVMHKVIYDEVKALRPKEKTYLPSYLAQLYAHGNCLIGEERMERKSIKNALRNVYGSTQDTLTDNEQEETQKEQT
jgi:hypothetical protein